MSDIVNASNDYQQQVIMTLHGTVRGSLQNVGSNVVPKFGIPSMHPTVTRPADGMVHITSITRKHKMCSSTQSGFFRKKPVLEMIDKLLASGVKREDIVCLVNPMSDAPRLGHYLVGGCYAHPIIAQMYEDYCSNKAEWQRKIIENGQYSIPTETTTDQTASPQPQFVPSKPTTPATPITPPKPPQQPTTAPKTGNNEELWNALVELTSIYGSQNMVERLDDVIFTYTDSMIGRGDLHTMETINCLRTIRDAFRIDELMRKIA